MLRVVQIYLHRDPALRITHEGTGTLCRALLDGKISEKKRRNLEDRQPLLKRISQAVGALIGYCFVFQARARFLSCDPHPIVSRDIHLFQWRNTV